MDLHFTDARPTDDDVAALDALLGPAPATPPARARRDQLLPALHSVHDRVGWISPGAVNEIGRRLGVAPADVYGVASFYARFSLDPRPTHVARVCTDVACMVNGSDSVLDDLARDDGTSTILRSPCLGRCDQAPAVLIEPHAKDAALRLHPHGDPSLVLLRRVGVVDPTSIADYLAHGGYAALARALELGPGAVVATICDSQLAGRGGAAFPTGRKWEAVARHPNRPHYVVCNADESEPGTFKDRVLLEGDPFAIVEAMTIAGYATGAERGFIYLRAEYPLALERLTDAVTSARDRGYLGHDVRHRGIHFDIEIRRGAGAYICGEETALFASIEGSRGEPRSKPPFPVDVGLFGRPTVMNNVETLANVLPIVLGEQSMETKLFSVSGCAARPGVYEVPFGTTLRELLDLAGGVRDGRALQAVLLGGAAGSFVGPHRLEMPLTLDATREIGATLGSGAVIVFDDRVDLAAVLLRIAEFFRDESCGQCVPCRVGTVRQEEALRRLMRDREEADLDLLADIGQVMRDASICGLGQTAANAIASAIHELGVFAAARQ